MKAAVEASGKSLRMLASELEAEGLHVSAGALSQWQNGQTTPHQSEDTRNRLLALERLLSLPPGGLVIPLDQTIGPGAPQPAPHRSRRSSRKPGLDEIRRLLEQQVADTGDLDNRNLALVRQVEHYIVGDRRRPVRTETELTVCALRSEISRYWCFYAYDPLAPLRPDAVDGCSCELVLDDVPPVVVDESTTYQVAAVELRFKEPLAVGSLHTFSYTFTYLYDEANLALPVREFRRIVTSPATRELLLKISFDPRQRPVDLQQAQWQLQPTNKPSITTQPAALHADGSAEPIHVANPAQRGYGYIWSWSTDAQAVP
jgi:transcriptional regulator with XRE-family HTH domain